MYRVRQFITALTAHVSDSDMTEVDMHLPPNARSLFRRMPCDGQAHALRVLRGLKQRGETNPSMLAAALLHDVGKTAARIGPVTRSIYVLMQNFAPRQLERLTQGSAKGWRAPIIAQHQHPRVGASWASDAGCDALTVSLIARHQDHVAGEEDHLLKILQEVDNRN